MNDGKRNIFTLCARLLDVFQRKKYNSFSVSLIANKFNVDEKWVERNIDKFDFVSSITLDYCISEVQEILRIAAPEKSGKLTFWIGVIIGAGIVIALNLKDLLELGLRPL
jgi:hypothetical protein